MTTPTIAHIVGPQGCGKAALTAWLGKTLGSTGQAVAVVRDDECHATNDELRALYRGSDLLIIEADERSERHSPAEHRPGDLLLAVAEVR